MTVSEEPAQEDIKPKVNLSVIYDGQSTTVKMKINTPLKKIFDAVEKKFAVPEGTLRFFADDKRLRPEETPADVGLEDGDQIDAHLEQLGGGSSC
ncbi:ubiquitin-like protein [Heliocybe sulcata]|uniref:Ubiquitin-like protein n=1 Tax=Heliocybe sulcata TaxID=5364 RepID=A0A5C3N0R7_9AGAM|nr:ubiquitin-like protein [Heliocybe sulcata]